MSTEIATVRRNLQTTANPKRKLVGRDIASYWMWCDVCVEYEKGGHVRADMVCTYIYICTRACGYFESISFSLGAIFEDKGEFGKAEEYYEQAMQNGSLEAAFTLGVLYDQQGKWEKAKDYYEQAMQNGSLEAACVMEHTLVCKTCVGLTSTCQRCTTTTGTNVAKPLHNISLERSMEAFQFAIFIILSKHMRRQRMMELPAKTCLILFRVPAQHSMQGCILILTPAHRSVFLVA